MEPTGLDWNLQPLQRDNIQKALNSNETRTIYSMRENEQLYFIQAIPTISLAEQSLLLEAISAYRETQEKNWDSESWLQYYCKLEKIELEEDQLRYLSKVMDWETAQSSVLTPLLEDDSLEEISIIGPQKPIHVFHRLLGWMPSNAFFENDSGIKSTINKISQTSGRRLSAQNPQLNATLSNGFRLNANISPVTQHVNATIRKFRSDPFQPLELASNGTISWNAISFLALAMRLDCSALIAGNTGSGKTTTLNALFYFVPKTDRVVVVEETPELSLPQSHVVKLKAVPTQGIGLNELTTQTLRMRPDRVIVGELRNLEESRAFIDTLLAGQGRSSYTTKMSHNHRNKVQYQS